MTGGMYTIASPSGPTTLHEVSLRLHVALSALDEEFGVTLIDPRQGLYAVMVDEGAAKDLETNSPGVRGPFSNPPIGTFGPPQPKRS